LEARSPFIYEDYVPRDKFFDRNKELDFFKRSVSLKRKMLLCIVAPLKYGKTSLMRRFHDILGEFGDIISIYVDLKKKMRPIKFIVDELKNHISDLDYTYERCIIDRDLEPLFDRINEYLADKNKWLFLLFDEFHLLPEKIRDEGFYIHSKDEVIFGFFRGVAEGARISYVVCGSIPEPLMRAINVWGGRFEIIYLGPFSKEDAVHMIKKLFSEGGIQISDEYAEIIADSAGYHPFYIQYMGHQIYMTGSIDRFSIREAKRGLYSFLTPLFSDYLKRIRNLGSIYIAVIRKLLDEEPLNIDDRIALGDLVRTGILKPKNTRFEFVDPLFKRYIKLILENLEPAEVNVVGHWAERIVGNYLLRRKYLPYYSHDSRGAFDIYVRIHNIDVGIQVKYSSSGEVYLQKEEYKKIHDTAISQRWVPILAIVQKEVRFFPITKHGKYLYVKGYRDIEDAIKNSKIN